MRSENELERMIDGALREYTEASPMAGIEDRVLRRVEASPARRFRFGWALAGLIAASVAAFLVGRLSPAPALQYPKPALMVLSAETSPEIGTALRRVPVRRKRGLPKREQFPTPQPLTKEEQALVFLAQAPNHGGELMLDLKKKASEPVNIEAIEIEPLQSDGAQ